MGETIRRATPADLVACRAVWLATQGEPGSVPDRPLPLHEHELATGLLLVAEEKGAVVGFGATLLRSGVAYVSDLFVHPDHQSRGLGRRILAGLLDDHPGPRFTMSSTDPRALHLYSSFGMAPVEVYSYLGARPADLRTSGSPAKDLGLLEEGGLAAVLDLDSAVTGRDRRSDLEYERRRLGALVFLGRRRTQVVGYGMLAHPVWWLPDHPDAARLGPLAVLDPADAAPVLGALVGEALKLDPGWLTAFLATGHPAHRWAIEAGFEVVGSDVLMASEPDVFDRRYLPVVDTA